MIDFEQRFGEHITVKRNTHVKIYVLWKRGIFCVVRVKILWAGQFKASSSVQLSKKGAVVELSMEGWEKLVARVWLWKEDLIRYIWSV
jgi:cytochrome c-type biogenesis protein CcmH/NrfF